MINSSENVRIYSLNSIEDVMAIYHMNVGFISRSQGRSAVQSCAYITGEKLHESRRGIVANYTNAHDEAIHFDTLIPEHAPKEFKDLSVWDKLESFEDAYAQKRFPNAFTAREKYQQSAQTAMTIVVALPQELCLESSRELVEEFVQERFIARDLIATYALHMNEGNPHAHIQVSRRSVNEEGEFSWAKDREICLKSALLETRKLWADLTNSYLIRDGFDCQITEKSFADLDINLEPSVKNGWQAYQREKNGFSSRTLSDNKSIAQDNAVRIMDNPSLLLDELHAHQSTFTQKHLLHLIQKRLSGTSYHHEMAHVFEKALSKAHVVGENRYGQLLYASSKAIDQERQTLEDIRVISGFDYEQSDYGLQVHLAEYEKEHPPSFTYTNAQKQAIHGLLSSKRFISLIGRAGSGKTSILTPVCKAYQKQGHAVIGGSLSVLASLNLGKDTGIQTKTLHAWLHAWRELEYAETQFMQYDAIVQEGLLKQLTWYKTLQRLTPYKLTNKHVFVVDEAGMLDTKIWHELMHFVKKSGCKVIACGDDHQLKAIGAGDVFRHVCSVTKAEGQSYGLSKIVRQKESWMVDASEAFADLDVYKGLSLYEKHGRVHAYDRQDQEPAFDDLAKRYVDQVTKSKTGFILSFTNKQVTTLNDHVRSLLKQKKMIGEDCLTVGERSFALGDRVVFLQNNKKDMQFYNPKTGERLEGKSHAVQNGLQGHIHHIDAKGQVHVALSDEKHVQFDPKTYPYLNHGYALTMHKAQGQTVDFTLVMASSYMDVKALYVAMTRHRESVDIFYDTKEFTSFDDLQRKLSHFEAKDLIEDYTIASQNRPYYERVQQYHVLTQDIVSVLKQRSSEQTIDYPLYHQLKIEQKEIAQSILKEFEAHRLYVQQSGLTKSILEVQAGLKERPQNKLDEKMALTVGLYHKTSALIKEHQALYQKETHHGEREKLMSSMKDLRIQRDERAQTVLDKRALYRDVVNKTPGVYFKAGGVS